MRDYELYVRGYRGKAFFSKLIKWFSWGEFSHVSLIFKMGEREEEIEAIEGSGVIIHPPKTEGDFVDLRVPVGYEKVIEAHVLAMSFIGAKYDWGGIWGILVRKTRHNKDKWFCSEFVAYILYKIGYLLSRREPYQESPSLVMKCLRLVEFASNESSEGESHPNECEI